MCQHPSSRATGFTLLELIISLSLVTILGLAIASYLYSGSILYVRNASLNHSHSSLRKALDRLADSLQTAKEVPTLIDTSGAAVTSGSAAGLRYDRFIAEPYVLHPAFTATNISSNATSLQVVRTTAGSAPPPRPSVGDTLLIDTPTGEIRSRITAVSADNNTGSQQARVTLTFSSALGSAVSWVTGEAKQARLVRREAFIVFSSAGKTQLRFYPSFEPMPNLNDPSKYIVITDQLETTTANAKPFSLVDPVKINGERMVQVDIRIRAQQFNKWLSTRENGGFNSFAAINMRLPSRLHPRTQEQE